jgi:hypothetical protein
LPIRVVDVTVPAGMKVALVRLGLPPSTRSLNSVCRTWRSIVTLVATTFDGFTAVLLDIAHHHRESRRVRDQLLRYCRAGGRRGMPNPTSERRQRLSVAGAVPADRRPRPRHRGEQPVAFLPPEHRLLNERIARATDFTGWV